MKIIHARFALPASRAGRALAFAIAAVSVSFGGCDKPEKPARAPLAEQEVAAVAAATDGKAETASSKTCADDDIACEERIYQLEETLFAYEAAVTKQIPEAAHACLKVDRDAFRQTVDKCTDFACRERLLLTRISSLHLLQPETMRAALELPETPLLLTVLAPDVADDDPLGPPDSELRFEVRGSLIRASEHPEHMGIAVSAQGKDHVFLYDMDVSNHPQHDEVLGLVGTSPTTQVVVRGRRLDAPTGVANFDPSQCRWVYEVANLAR
jgi:hypothetical protein